MANEIGLGTAFIIGAVVGHELKEHKRKHPVKRKQPKKKQPHLKLLF